jgi:hypothetical protein
LLFRRRPRRRWWAPEGVRSREGRGSLEPFLWMARRCASALPVRFFPTQRWARPRECPHLTPRFR